VFDDKFENQDDQKQAMPRSLLLVVCNGVIAICLWGLLAAGWSEGYDIAILLVIAIGATVIVVLDLLERWLPAQATVHVSTVGRWLAPTKGLVIVGFCVLALIGDMGWKIQGATALLLVYLLVVAVLQTRGCRLFDGWRFQSLKVFWFTFAFASMYWALLGAVFVEAISFFIDEAQYWKAFLIVLSAIGAFVPPAVWLWMGARALRDT